MLQFVLVGLACAAFVKWCIDEDAPNAEPDPQSGDASLQEQVAITAPARSALRDSGSAPLTVFDPKGTLVASLNNQLLVAAGSLGLAVLGALVSPIAGLLSVPLIVYSYIPLFQEAYHSVVKEHRLRSSVMGVVTSILCLMTGYYVPMALIGVMYLLSRRLLLETEDHTRQKLMNLFGAQPRSVWILKEGVEIEVPFERLEQGDIVVVTAGQAIAVDGIVLRGMGSVDQHVLTGESQPVEKGPEDSVLAGTLLLTGRIYIRTEKTGSSTLAGQVGVILNRTADYRDELESRGESLADRAVLPMLGLSAVAGLTMGAPSVVAILSCDFIEGMKMTVPLSMLNYLKLAAEQGILIKDGRVLDLLHDIDTVVFDKTGTLTLDQPHLESIHPCGETGADELLRLAAAVEARQSHPIARAIQAAASERALELPAIDNAHYEVGYGIVAEIDRRKIRVGSARYIEHEGIVVPDTMQAMQKHAHMHGSSIVYVAIDDQLAGALELHPTVRPEARQVVRELKSRGLSLCIISGDHEFQTRRLAEELEIDQYFAEVLPEAKAELVAQLKKNGHKVCFVGDGINDSIALKTATASVSLRGATTVATDAAQIVLMDATLSKLPRIFELSKEFDSNVKVSLATALVPAAFCIGGVFFLNFGVYTALFLWPLSLAANVGNAMLPMLRNRKTDLAKSPGTDLAD